MDKYVKTGSFKRDIMNLIQTNHQIKTRLKAISMLRVSISFWHCSSCVKHGASGSESVAKVIWTYKGGVYSAWGEKWKEP